jgi:hypothetical protein
VAVPPQLPASPQPSRRATKAITVHYPAEVRRQLKMLAVEEGRNIDDMVAEALNLLFVKYRKAEIAPRKTQPDQPLTFYGPLCRPVDGFDGYALAWRDADAAIRRRSMYRRAVQSGHSPATRTDQLWQREAWQRTAAAHPNGWDACHSRMPHYSGIASVGTAGAYLRIVPETQVNSN